MTPVITVCIYTDNVNEKQILNKFSLSNAKHTQVYSGINYSNTAETEQIRNQKYLQ